MSTMRGKFVTQSWPANPAGQTVKERRGGIFQAFIPDLIADLDLELSGELASSLEDATRNLIELNTRSPKLASLEAVARYLLRQESLASSRIEGLQLGARRIALADFGQDSIGDSKAVDIVGNIDAMRIAVEIACRSEKIKPADILEIHRILLRFGRDEAIAGKWRTSQGWIGGVQPTHAAYVPPPHTEIPQLIGDLCGLLNRTDLPVVAQAAIAHAQFENIHPFPDGNGRVGRCLIHMVLKRRGTTPHFVPPISVILAARRNQYFAGLEDFRSDGLYRWVAFFADVVSTAIRQTTHLSNLLDELECEWLKRFENKLRSDSAARRIMTILPGQPILDVATVMRELNLSDRAAGNALNELETREVVRLIGAKVRGRVWECPAVFELMNKFEKTLLSNN